MCWIWESSKNVPSLKCDLGALLGITRAEDGTNKAERAAINLIFDERAGLRYEQIAHYMTYGKAEKGVAVILDHDEHAFYYKIRRFDYFQFPIII